MNGVSQGQGGCGPGSWPQRPGLQRLSKWPQHAVHSDSFMVSIFPTKKPKPSCRGLFCPKSQSRPIPQGAQRRTQSWVSRLLCDPQTAPSKTIHKVSTMCRPVTGDRETSHPLRSPRCGGWPSVTAPTNTQGNREPSFPDSLFEGANTKLHRYPTPKTFRAHFLHKGHSLS